MAAQYIKNALCAATLAGLSLSATFAAAADNSTIPPRVVALYDNAADICAPITADGPDADLNAKIQTTRDLLNHSATGAALLQAAENYAQGPVWICYGGEGTQNKAAYFAGQGVLTVQDSTDQTDTIGATLHELRHMQQEQNGYIDDQGGSGLKELRDRIDAEFILEADAEAVAVTGLWEMHQNGVTAPWDIYNDATLCAAEKLCYAPIGHAFTAALSQGKDEGGAASAAFRQWYEDGQRLFMYRWAVAARGMNSNAYDNPHRRDTTRPGTPPDPYSFTIPSQAVLDKMSGVGCLPATGADYLASAGGIAALLGSPALINQP